MLGFFTRFCSTVAWSCRGRPGCTGDLLVACGACPSVWCTGLLLVPGTGESLVTDFAPIANALVTMTSVPLPLVFPRGNATRCSVRACVAPSAHYTCEKWFSSVHQYLRRLFPNAWESQMRASLLPGSGTPASPRAAPHSSCLPGSSEAPASPPPHPCPCQCAVHPCLSRHATRRFQSTRHHHQRRHQIRQWGVAAIRPAITVHRTRHTPKKTPVPPT